MDELRNETAKFIEKVKLIIERIDDDIAKQRIELEAIRKERGDLNTLKSTLEEERKLIDKEKAIDAERKLRLNAQEKILKERLEKAQRLFDV
jgi:hypothetical protein